MLRIILVLFLVLSASTTRADEPPPVPEGGLLHLYDNECTDEETGISGHCYVMQSLDGVVYVTFFIGEELMFIRRIVGDTYEVEWVNAAYGSI